MITVKDKVIKHRVSVCNRCEHFDKKEQRCKICGCKLYVIATHPSKKKCPLLKFKM